MPTSEEKDWSVEIETSGRSGVISYHEGSRSIPFDWEFGGGDTVATIYLGQPALWNRRHSWAVDRKQEIAERVAEEVIRQKAPDCTADIDLENGSIHLRKKK
jgi:hypothetical protein